MSDANEPSEGATTTAENERRVRIEAGVRSVREGHGANCSSIGSVIDTIFATAVLGGAVLAAVVASLGEGKENVRVVGDPESASRASPATGSEEESR